MHSLRLLIPGLIWPFDKLAVDKVPRFPALEILLGKSDKYLTDPESFYTQLCYLFGLEKAPDRDFPLAALSRLVDDSGHPEGVWMRADPVHLQTVRDGLCLLDATTFSLTQHDAILAGTLLNKLFAEYGWHFEIPVAKRWYLQLDQLPHICTEDISAVRGKDVQLLMSRGENKSTLDRLMTEVQMLLHDCDFNQQREENGDRIINSLWFWGCGSLPEIQERKWSSLIADDPIAQGLAMLSGTPFVNDINNLEEILGRADNPGEHLLVRDDLQTKVCYQDYTGWHDAVVTLEEAYFVPLLDALKKGRLARLTITSDTREFEISKGSLGKFWRRRKPISFYT